MTDQTPMLLTVAPNGARLGKDDYPNIPISAQELAQCAEDCMKAGAAMIHLHVRDEEDKHILCAKRYQTAIDAIRDRVGMDMVIQVTTEAVGMYSAHEQMTLVGELKPEAVSLGLRELLPEDGDEKAFRDFWQWMKIEKIWPQIILYDADDVRRLISLREAGVFGKDHLSVLFVLGRYGKQLAQADELIPFVSAAAPMTNYDWSICAFGHNENACVTAAACFGGHGRLGFENNQRLADGTVVKDNTPLIEQAATCAKMVGRRLLSAQELRRLRGFG